MTDASGSHPPYAWPDYRSTRLRAPQRPLVPLPHNLTEVTGPLLGAERVGKWDHDLTRQHASEPLGQRVAVHGRVVSLGLAWADGPHVVDFAAPGAVRISGRLLDGNGEPVGDGMIETWQADPDGTFSPDSFRGFGRCLTDATGAWEIVTLKPGTPPAPDGATEAPHLDLSVFARGLLHRLVTRIYFADEDAANAKDPVLSALPDGAARATLIADSVEGGYHLDIHLQGPDETVFFVL